MRVLELGSYVAPAYAGMILAEQGHEVVKWVKPDADPILGLRDGDALWEWINHGKRVVDMDARLVAAGAEEFDVVIDNIRADTWARWGVDPEHVATSLGLPWVSLRDDFDGRGFDAVAQARAWGDHVGYVPTYIGDTSAGLWLAFKALSMAQQGETGHRVLHQGACLAKLIEGEGVVTPSRPRSRANRWTPPWDEPGTYGRETGASYWEPGTVVQFKGETIREPFRDEAWRRAHLRHDGSGRYVI